ncbi:MAG: alpha/beta hydrolase [Ktedonobacteraceae bacterium]|nr:alpha/beta hydrolase [Ktedonobacteraceae bacterium]
MHNVLVFIHGSGDDSRIWRQQIDYFGEQRALAIDLPGHGQRPDILPSTATVRDYAHAVSRIVHDELHLSRPIIAGHSLGGAIALTMALEYSDTLAGLLLIGTGARLRVLPTLLEEAQQAPWQAKTHLTELAATPDFVRTLLPAAPAGPFSASANNLYRDLAACNSFDIMTQLHEIQLPALIICGTEDRLTPAKYSQYLHQQLQHSTLYLLPHSGHYVMCEQAEAVNSAIEQWIKTLQL